MSDRWTKGHFPLGSVQQALRDEGLDGWLFFYFQNNDPLALRLLRVPANKFFTRRWFYFVPGRGAPVKLVHRIEPDALDHLPGRTLSYATWRELEAGLARTLRGARKVAMQYSPKNAVPYISRVDAGTVELVRSLGPRVVSSGDLVQRFESVLTPGQWRQHQQTARHLHQIVRKAFAFIGRSVRGKGKITEFDVQRFILREYLRRHLITNADPIVAVNKNSARPHYAPTRARHAPVQKGDWVLLDIWAKPRGAEAVYADITWCGYVGAKTPEKHERIFQIVRRARDAAVEFVQNRLAEGKAVRGWEVDRAARSVIERAGYGKYFIHRTGHSIGTEDHANGANMDGLETRETRRLLPGTLFSIEPGIYLRDFGVRSEINVGLPGGRAVVTGATQRNSWAILGENPA